VTANGSAQTAPTRFVDAGDVRLAHRRLGAGAGRAFIERQARRTTDRDPDSTQQAVGAQSRAIVEGLRFLDGA
jgi:hypothetical protein